MRMISHRELRNDSGAVFRALAAGDELLLTNNGEPVAHLTPIAQRLPELPVSRAARKRGGLSEIKRQAPVRPTQQTLDDLRGDRL